MSDSDNKKLSPPDSGPEKQGVGSMLEKVFSKGLGSLAKTTSDTENDNKMKSLERLIGDGLRNSFGARSNGSKASRGSNR